MNNIFISYRREDSKYVCDRVNDALTTVFGQSEVFRDIDGIPAGTDFRQVIQARLRQCRVALVIMGPTWATIADSNGRPRLSDPQDFVRLEVATALAQGIPVIPVLVQGATMPNARELPPELQQIVYQNAVQVRADPDYQHDIERLIGAIGAYVPRQAPIPQNLSMPVVSSRAVRRIGGAALAALILLPILVIGSLGFIAWKTVFSAGGLNGLFNSSDTSGAHGTLTAFCHALHTQQYAQAYGDLASASTLRQSVGPDSRMATKLGVKDLGDSNVTVTDCRAFAQGFDGFYKESGDTASDTVTFTVTDTRDSSPHDVGNYTMNFVKENGQWKVDSIISGV